MMPESAVESATLGWFECLGYRIVNGPDIAPDGSSPLRQSFADVVLGSPLADAISRINPDLPASAVDDVVRKVVRGQRCIDKSVFRRNIGRRERIAPGRPTVNYIREHFELAWVVLPQSEIAILERDLIARIAAKWDLYNLDGNPLAPRRRTQEAVSQLSAG